MHRTLLERFDFKFSGLFLVDKLFVFILIFQNQFGDGGVFLLVIHEVARLVGMAFSIYFASGDISNSMGGGRETQEIFFPHFVPVDRNGGIFFLAVRNQRVR
jgi:hypothetical protein